VIKWAAVVVLIAVTVLMLAMYTAAVANPDPEHNSRNSVDWNGIYRGVLPCADCEGIETVVVLDKEGEYRMWSRYLGKDTGVIAEQGQFAWNDAGSAVRFLGPSNMQFLVGENRLIRLAQDGSRMGGKIGEAYVLTRLGEGIAGKYWKLIELNGKPVPKLEREPYVLLDEEGGRLSGFGGCNRLGGTFELDEMTSFIRFAQIFSTRMVCEAGTAIELDLNDALQNVDSYTLAGNRLTLNRTSFFTPLAQFELMDDPD